jgi:hypothetical protein
MIGMAYLETSAKEGLNVEKAFETMCNAIFDKMKNYINNEVDDFIQSTPTVSISSQKETPNNFDKKCC